MAFWCEVYFFPNDEVRLRPKKLKTVWTNALFQSEQERLDLQHQLFLLTFDNKLSLVPTEGRQLHNVLDIGTGTGIWAIDFGMDGTFR